MLLLTVITSLTLRNARPLTWVILFKLKNEKKLLSRESYVPNRHLQYLQNVFSNDLNTNRFKNYYVRVTVCCVTNVNIGLKQNVKKSIIED